MQLALSCSLASLAVNANPLDGQVVGGMATINGTGTAGVTITQTSPWAVIDWRSFNIDQGESATFIQPDANSRILNRVTGGLGASQINGLLTGNGGVYIVNPDGLLFGPSAQVNVGSFLATTHDIKTSDFMSGRTSFTVSGKANASVVNEGSISAAEGGFAALVAPGVRNSGVITANLGTIALAAGNSFTLDLYGDNLIALQPDDAIAAQVIDVVTGQPMASLVENTGKLKAHGGKVALTAAAAKAVVDSVINTSGLVEADSVGSKNGEVIFGVATADSKSADAAKQKVKVSGKVSAAGRKRGTAGGKIRVTGETIDLQAATLDVSGNAGGGTVTIGGGPRGEGPIGHASTVTADTATLIDASATLAGNGGSVVVWSDTATSFAGQITSRGGASGGDGGLAEVSSRGYLSLTGGADLSASAGKRGTLLFDPYNITIVAAANSFSTDWRGIFTPGSQSSISAATLTALLARQNVVIETGSGGNEAGNITVASNLAWTTPTVLTLSAAGRIVVEAGVTITNPANEAGVVLRADSGGLGYDPVTQRGTVTLLGSGKQISLPHGTVQIFYDSADNPASLRSVNPRSYSSGGLDYSARVASANPADLPVASILVNDIYDLENINNALGGFYALGADIDASIAASWNGGTGFSPIAQRALIHNTAFSVNWNSFTASYDSFYPAMSAGNPFQGVLNGQNHAITNLSINYGSSLDNEIQVVALVASISTTGVVRNLVLKNPQIIAGGVVGGVAAYNAGTIENIQISGGAVIATTSFVAGAAAAFNDRGLIRNVSSSARVGDASGRGDTPADYYFNGYVPYGTTSGAGGLVGVNYKGTVTSSNVTNTSVGSSGLGIDIYGGLVGANFGRIENSYVSGLSLTYGMAAGGLAGLNANTGVIVNSYASATVAPSFVMQKTGFYQGGLVGVNGGTIISSISNVTQSRTAAVGAGLSFEDMIGAEYNPPMPGLPEAQTGTLSLTTDQMQDFSTFQSVYAGWDFGSVWAPPTQAGQAGEAAAYPALYATSPVIWAQVESTSVASNAYEPGSIRTTMSGGPALYAFGNPGDSVTAPAVITVPAGSPAGTYSPRQGLTAISSGGIVYSVLTSGTLTITPAPVAVPDPVIAPTVKPAVLAATLAQITNPAATSLTLATRNAPLPTLTSRLIDDTRITFAPSMAASIATGFAPSTTPAIAPSNAPAIAAGTQNPAVESTTTDKTACAENQSQNSSCQN